MALSPADRLRSFLNEAIPTGGSASDTSFTDEQIDQMLVDAGNNPERAAIEGWRIKAAQYADLVDVTEGNASRAMSDLQKHALEMVKLYQRSAEGPTEGRTRIGRIRRSG